MDRLLYVNRYKASWLSRRKAVEIQCGNFAFGANTNLSTKVRKEPQILFPSPHSFVGETSTKKRIERGLDILLLPKQTLLFPPYPPFLVLFFIPIIQFTFLHLGLFWIGMGMDMGLSLLWALCYHILGCG